MIIYIVYAQILQTYNAKVGIWIHSTTNKTLILNEGYATLSYVCPCDEITKNEICFNIYDIPKVHIK